jgi:hypothetical protein
VKQFWLAEKHFDELTVSTYVPDIQRVQADAPGPEAEPRKHPSHVSLLVAPVLEDAVPALHNVQLDDPANDA